MYHILGRREEEKNAIERLSEMENAPAHEIDRLEGKYYEAVGDYDRAQEALNRCLQSCKELGNILLEADILTQLGLIARRQGDYDNAMTRNENALKLLQSPEIDPSDSARFRAQTLSELGVVNRQKGDFEAAAGCFSQALELFNNQENKKGMADVLNHLGGLAQYQRDLEQAIVHHQEALKIRRTIGDRAGEGTSLFNLAAVTLELGDYGQAQDFLFSALEIQRSIGNRWEEANILNVWGILYLDLGKYTLAKSNLQDAITLCEVLGDQVGKAYAMTNLGLVERNMNRLAEAEKVLNLSLELAIEQDDQYLVTLILSYRSDVSLMHNRYQEAIERATAALDKRQKSDLTLQTTAELATLAAAHCGLGENAKAADFASKAMNLLIECQGEGPEAPHRDYWLCYRVFSATGEHEKANEALVAAKKMLLERANKIIDMDLRESFLECVAINSEIMGE